MLNGPKPVKNRLPGRACVTAVSLGMPTRKHQAQLVTWDTLSTVSPITLGSSGEAKFLGLGQKMATLRVLLRRETVYRDSSCPYTCTR